MDYQVVVIGAGPGGYPAAIKAAQLGARVCLIESREIGGTCLNRGCIPTKALVESAATLERVRRAMDYGVVAGEASLDLKRINSRQDEIVNRLRKGIKFLLDRNRIDQLAGSARLLESGRVEVIRTDSGREELTAEKVILATGSEPLLPPALGYDGQSVVSSTELLHPEKIPESLIIIGGGVIGCEFARIYGAFGSRVTIIEAQPTILPGIDEDLARKLQAGFKQQGIIVRTKTRVRSVCKEGGVVEVELEDGSRLAAEKLLVAIGRRLNNAGLAEAGIALGERGEVLVNERMETSKPGVYAVGDITGKALLAHMATAQGLVAAANALGIDEMVDYRAVPGCIFTHPKVAGVGITGREAKVRGMAVKVGKYPFSGNGRALCEGEEDGFVKVIASADNHRVLGLHIIGPQATELIVEGALAVRWGLTLDQLVATIHAHPTLAEALVGACELALTAK